MQPRLPDKESKDRRLIVLIVLLVASLAITTLWFREADDGPLHRVRAGVSVATSPFLKAGRWVFTPVRAVANWTASLGGDRAEIETLRSQNEELRVRVMQLEESRLEAGRLRDLLMIHDALELDSIGARVIRDTGDSWARVMTIDKGTSSGVGVGDPVLSKDGLLGQVVEVAATSARVRLITDQRSGVAVLIQSSRAEGVVRGNVDGTLTFDYVDNDIEVAVGDVVITSGTGGAYPKGLVVGEVLSVGEVGNSIFRKIMVAPAASTAGIEEVVVIVGAIPAPIDGVVDTVPSQEAPESVDTTDTLPAGDE